MKRKQTIILTALSAIAASMLLASCSGAPSGSSVVEATSPSGQAVVVYHPDYPSFDSAIKMIDSADTIIVATVTEPARAQRMQPLPAGTDAQSNPGGPSVAQSDLPVQSVVSVVVVRTVKGASKAGEKMEVGQLGGKMDGVDFQAPEVTPLEVGKTYLLLLHTFPDRPAALVNPTQGQYLMGAGSSFVALPGNAVNLSDAVFRSAGLNGS